MLFNSPAFLLFLPLTLGIYYLLPHRRQNTFLVLASCFFYASWDWRFLFPLLFSTTIDYVCARAMEKSLAAGEPNTARYRYLVISLVTNLGLLAFFKYFNFFVDSFHDLGLILSIDIPVPALRVILPIGISFYTFQALSYTIDVYRGQIHATKSFWDFFLAVLFFPHLVAGPIQRASNLIGQVTHPRKVTTSLFLSGLHLMVWGFFKKVFIADSLAPIANGVFDLPDAAGGQVLVGVLAFAFQIYCDFSGYTDIARGVARLMGFEFMLNFNLPYFATSPPDFWKRWHISLSAWLRDYLYISLGGNRGNQLMTYRNLMLTMVLGGLWHGAAWNYVFWGAYHGGILVLHRLVSPWLPVDAGQRDAAGRAAWLALRMVVMFAMTCYGWLLFRATSLQQVVEMTASLASPLAGLPVQDLLRVCLFAAPLVVVQCVQYATGRLEFMDQPWLPPVVRSVLYAAMTYCIVFHGGEPQAFVYFQF